VNLANIPPLKIREDLIAGREIALLDVREEEPHASGHPLFAANLPLSRIELDAYRRLPRFTVPIVLFDGGEGYVPRAAQTLAAMGYSDISVLEDGLQGWIDTGYEIFRDVNAPSKAFGELVESERHTPSLSAHEVEDLIAKGSDIVIVDVRRYDEFQTMSIPTAVSLPGGELVLRIRDLAPRPETRVVVNCAGRTRSIIGTQSLVNAGIPNSVTALRNGTIGWKLAHQQLAHGVSAKLFEVSEQTRMTAARDARSVADRAGVNRIDKVELQRLLAMNTITTYRFDVRVPEEYALSHLPGFLNAPGGQLVQETDMFVPVRGAHIVLTDADGVRANMTASWLAQMNWRVFVLDGLAVEDMTEVGVPEPRVAALPEIPPAYLLTPLSAQATLASKPDCVVLDFTPSHQYRQWHIPGAWFSMRSRLSQAIKSTSHSSGYLLTSQDGAAHDYSHPEFAAITDKPAFILNGGNEAWASAGLPLTSAEPRYASEPIDRYRRPYEGIDAPASAMQAYLDWEFGLVEQLGRDGTHGFRVI
jgi:rhodanese-related sulfurtransferase